MWNVCVGAQPQVLQCKGSLMVPMGCPAAANGKQRLHRCLARVVDYSLLEGGGLTSTPAQLGRAPGEGPDQCLLWKHMPSLRFKLSKPQIFTWRQQTLLEVRRAWHACVSSQRVIKSSPSRFWIFCSLSVCAAGDAPAHAVTGTSAGDHEEHTWAFRLHLQDATASIVANVSAIDGDAFFTVDKVLRLVSPRAVPW